ncbi:hypothetical protein B9Y66_19890 [Stenotrophomonas maltophilia]|nr:hypothetical protein B9Y66_19890 [Stenotrophomonas maltophilia]
MNALAALARVTVVIAGMLAGDSSHERPAFHDHAERFAPGIVSTRYSEIRLTLSPDGRAALWFSRDRPGGAGGYDIWISRLQHDQWSVARPVPFNTPGRDFDPAFTADGRFVLFCSDRPGGMGGDDLYKVPVQGLQFGVAEHLGSAVNSPANEFAPMLAPDGGTLLFSSDRAGGAGGHDLYVARLDGGQLQPARPVAGAINTAAQEFDATFLGDGRTIVFARAQDFGSSRVEQFAARAFGDRYEPGTRLPAPINDGANDSYGAMLDWSRPGTLTYSARGGDGASLDLYRVSYRLPPSLSIPGPPVRR